MDAVFHWDSRQFDEKITFLLTDTYKATIFCTPVISSLLFEYK